MVRGEIWELFGNSNKDIGEFTMEIAFTVGGRPPRKGGALAMWGMDTEVPLLIRLRKQALDARRQANLGGCFNTLVRLQLKVFVPKSKLADVGDLDTFVAGVFDGLQDADDQAIPHLHADWNDPDLEDIHPQHDILIDDDAKIISIIADKEPIDEEQEVFYTVVMRVV